MSKDIKISENDYLRLKECLDEVNEIIQRIEDSSVKPKFKKVSPQKKRELKYERLLSGLK